MTSPIYFISDLHFHIDRTDQDNEKVTRLRSLFKDIKAQQGILYIVGDLFDFWFEYHYVIPRQHFDLLVLLHDLSHSGVEIHYLAGNHDYWAETFFQDDLGIQLHGNPIDLVRNGKRLWICHGDGILSKDSGYRKMKKVFRHPWVIRMFRFIHPDLGFKIARKVASTSRKYNAFDPEKNRHLVEKAYDEYVLSKFREGYDYVLMGHFHHPYLSEENGKTYVNLGDWMHYYSFAIFDQGIITLNYFPSPDNNES